MGPTITPDTNTAKDSPEPTSTGYNNYPVTHPEVSAPAPVAAVAPAASIQYGLQTNDGRQPGTYLPEYLVQLILLAVIIGAITSLFATGLDSVISAETTSKASDYGADFSSFQLTWALASLLSALPLFAWLFIRTRKVQAEIPEVRNHRWRRGFLAGFIVLELLTIVSAVNSMLFDLIGRAIGEDSSGIFSYFASGDKDPWWQVVLVTVVSVALIGYVVYVMARDYRKREV